jgi:Ca2+-transporting ATPase
MIYHQTDIQDAMKAFNSSIEGLSKQEAAERLTKNGLNVLQEQKKRSIFKMIISQFTDFMILVLIAAAVISGIIGEISDTYVILFIVVLNAVIGFVQEYRAEKAMAALKKLATSFAQVVREGQVIRLPSSELVVGDIVLLEAGNSVPADLRVIESIQLNVQEASLTGESSEVEKFSEALKDEKLPLGDRKNMLYKSTFVNNGRGKGIVVATSMDTELGKIAKLLSGEETETPLQKRLAKFGKNLSYIILVICTIFFLIGVLRGDEPMNMLLTAISLAVAAIPEALPALIVIALALGAKRLVEHKALIRRLPAVETLGSVTYICSDKTGTLTLNKMMVEEVFIGERIPLKQGLIQKADQENEKQIWLLRAMALNNDVSRDEKGLVMGDSTELASYEWARLNQFKKEELELKFPRVAEIPFDSVRKCMSTIHHTGHEYIAFVKGAAEVLIAKDSSLSKEGKEKFVKASNQMASQGLRVLGFAMRTFSALPHSIQPDSVETDLQFIGICGMMDPPREEVKKAISMCKTAGIQSVMITGDHPVTATTIAKMLGIIEHENDLTITGAELEAMSDDEFTSKVEHIRVYGRVSPEQKLKIVMALQAQGQFVAMTGDGVNDAPSLKRADIGIAMGITGTDVSKEAAHMILLDDNFTTIVNAIKQGRRIFDNIRKFIKYILTGNSAEIWTLFLAPLFGLPIPFLPIHILWINLVTDGLPGLALATEPAEKGVMARKPRHPKQSIFADGMGIHILWVGVLMGLICLGTQAFAIKNHILHWQTLIFSVLCFSQLGHLLAIRSNKTSFFSSGIFTNKTLLLTVLFTFNLQISTIYLPFFNRILKTEPLTMIELAMALGVSCMVFVAVEIEKLIKRKVLKN